MSSEESLINGTELYKYVLCRQNCIILGQLFIYALTEHSARTIAEMFF